MSREYSSTVDLIADLRKPKKVVKYKGYNKKKGRRQDLRKFFKEKTIKKANKEEYTNDLIANFDGFEKEIRRLYSKNQSKVFDDREDLVDLLTNPKFCKILCKALKTMKEEEPELEIPYVVLFAIGDMYVRSDEAFTEDEEISSRYMKVFNMFFEKKIKKLAKRLQTGKPDALALYLTSLTFKDVSYKVLNRRIYTFLNHLYSIEGLDESKAKLAIKSCFGRE